MHCKGRSPLTMGDHSGCVQPARPGSRVTRALTVSPVGVAAGQARGTCWLEEPSAGQPGGGAP